MNTEQRAALIAAIVRESRAAWEAGLQNCAGPIDSAGADRIIAKALGERHDQKDHPCNCGSGDCGSGNCG